MPSKNPLTKKTKGRTRVPIHMSVAEWAEHLGVSLTTMQSAINNGMFPNYSLPPSAKDRVGGKIIIPETDIEKWLAMGKPLKP